MSEPTTSAREPIVRGLAELAAPDLDPERAAVVLHDLDLRLGAGEAVETAGRLGLLPLTALRLTGLPRDVVPPAWLDAFRPWRRHFVARSLLGLRSLERVLRVLRSGGIEAVNLKGPVLALATTGDASARSFEDLDLLIHPDEVPAALAALEGAGWEVYPGIPREHLDEYRRLGCEVPLVRDGEPVVDLHWDLFPAYFVTDGLRGGLRTATVDSMVGPLRGLDAPGRLLHASLHAAMDRWPDLASVADVAWTASDDTIDWAPFTRTVARAGLGKVLGVNLALARSFFGVRVAPAARPLVARHGRLGGLARTIERRLAAGVGRATGTADAAAAHALLRERLADRWRVVSRHAFTPRPGEWDRHPGLQALVGGLRFLRSGSRVLRDGDAG